MSKKNGRTNTNPPYISRVHLKGYKSIIDTKIDLHPGLNIIIGPNGSGKTNFLEFLRDVLNSNPPRNTFYVSLEISHNNKTNIWEGNYSSRSNIETFEIEERYYAKGEKKPKKSIYTLVKNGYKRGHPSEYLKAMNSARFGLWPTLIQFDLPNFLTGLSLSLIHI